MYDKAYHINDRIWQTQKNNAKTTFCHQTPDKIVNNINRNNKTVAIILVGLNIRLNWLIGPNKNIVLFIDIIKEKIIK